MRSMLELAKRNLIPAKTWHLGVAPRKRVSPAEPAAGGEYHITQLWKEEKGGTQYNAGRLRGVAAAT